MTRSARELLVAGAGATTFALAFSYPILGRLSRAGFHHDWDFMAQLHWVAYVSVSEFHQLPLWNPYKCGGMPMLGNPESRFLTPFFLLHLMFGPVIGAHLEIVLHLAVAWGGGYLLARALGLGRLGAVACASVFPAASWVYLHAAAGQLVFLPALYLPWIAVSVWLAVEQRRLSLAALAGLLVAVMLGEGGVYPVLHTLLFMGLVTLTLAASRASLWPLAVMLTFALFSAGFSAVKLLPAVDLVRAHPRPVANLDWNPFGALLNMLLSRDQDFYRHYGWWSFHEYGAYVGVIAAMLAGVGVVSSLRRVLPWLVAAGALLALAMGNYGPASPWTLLHGLPVFSSSRIPSRLLVPLTLAIAVLAGFGADRMQQLRRPLGRAIALVAVTALLVDSWNVGPRNLRHIFAGQESVHPVSPTFRQMRTEDGPSEMLAYARANMGAVACYENAVFRSPVRGAGEFGYRGEQYLLGRGSVKLFEWTPNALGFAIETDQPSVLVVNQNHDDGWRLAEGSGEVFSHRGLLAIRLPAGRSRLRLVYRSGAFVLGLLITTMTGLAALVLWLQERRTWRLRAARSTCSTRTRA